MPSDQSVRTNNADILLHSDISYPLSSALDSIHGALEFPQSQEFPLYGCPITAGFPSPASDYLEDNLDLNEFMIEHPSATFFVRVAGDSMINAGIFQGDYLIVDRSLQVSQNDIVIAVVNGELTVKRFFKSGATIELRPENDAFSVITIQGTVELLIWGVVTGVFRKHKAGRKVASPHSFGGRE